LLRLIYRLSETPPEHQPSEGYMQLPSSGCRQKFLSLFLLFLLAALTASGQYAPNRYALILEDPPVAARFSAVSGLRNPAAENYRLELETRRMALEAELRSRRIPMVAAAGTLVNAVFVTAAEDRLFELRNLPGVRAVLPVRRYRRSLNRAVDLVRVSQAWNVLGGAASSGFGQKIAILDTGIDNTHPAFNDEALAPPPGYPICSGDDCNFTNNKIIVARSYVRMLAAGTSPSNPAADSRPDDYSPRDREGHGTAVASIAAASGSTGPISFRGVAPKAWIGNYKIYGTPGVNDFTTDDVIIQALEDAIRDGMDIISFSTGGPAFTGALDAGEACGLPAGVPCDLAAAAFENAARVGIIIVAAAGNEGNDGLFSPTYGSLASPAGAPSVIAVGASSNSHYFLPTVSLADDDAPSALKGIETRTGDAYIPYGAIKAPLRDVAALDGTGLACSKLPEYSLLGSFALILRGECLFSQKVANAEAAGAAGVIFYMADDSPLVSPGGLGSSWTPAAMISNAAGVALKAYLAEHPEAQVILDPNGAELDYPYPDELAGFSSRGPAQGDASLKPELVAPGTYIYTAGQNYDLNGFLFSESRYVAANGTSFATPLVAGAAALLRQQHPDFTADQVRSALVNTASAEVATDETGSRVDVRGVGAGKINAEAALKTTVTVSPATLSFGELRAGSLPLSRQLQITNVSSGAVSLTISVTATVASLGTNLSLSSTQISLLPGATSTLTVTLSGAMPSAGAYSGSIVLQGSGFSLRVPYLYLVASNTAANLIPLAGSSFDGTVGQPIPTGIIAFKAVDANGLPVRNLPVTWSASGGRFTSLSSATDNYGVAFARPVLGLTPGIYTYTAQTGGLSITFRGYARSVPAISAVVNAASFEPGAPVAPGSYVSIFGANLSDTTRANAQARLPLAIDYVNVSFDVPSAGLSLPGRLTYISPTQINAQVPWELAGFSEVQVKVIISETYGNVVKLPLADYAPAFFEIPGGTAAALDENNQVITSSNPAQRGKKAQFFLNGLGPVTNRPASGEPAPLNPLAETINKPVVTIAGRQLTPDWSGLTPTLHGLYQINVTLPEDLPAGNLPVTVTIGGKTSKSSILPVK